MRFKDLVTRCRGVVVWGDLGACGAFQGTISASDIARSGNRIQLDALDCLSCGGLDMVLRDSVLGTSMRSRLPTPDLQTGHR